MCLVNVFMNILTLAEVESIWIPRILFENTENNDVTQGDEESELYITRRNDDLKNLKII